MLSDVCYDIDIEPHIRSLQGEIFALESTTTDEGARLDVNVDGLRESRFNKFNFDVTIFNQFAKSLPENSWESYKYHESIKKQILTKNHWGWERHSLSAFLRMHCLSWPISSKSAETTDTKALCAKKESYAIIISYIRKKNSFALLSSSIHCIGGSNTLRWREVVDASLRAVAEEGGLLVWLIYFRH